MPSSSTSTWSAVAPRSSTVASCPRSPRRWTFTPGDGHQLCHRALLAAVVGRADLGREGGRVLVVGGQLGGVAGGDVHRRQLGVGWRRGGARLQLRHGPHRPGQNQGEQRDDNGTFLGSHVAPRPLHRRGEANLGAPIAPSTGAEISWLPRLRRNVRRDTLPPSPRFHASGDCRRLSNRGYSGGTAPVFDRLPSAWVDVDVAQAQGKGKGSGITTSLTESVSVHR